MPALWLPLARPSPPPQPTPTPTHPPTRHPRPCPRRATSCDRATPCGRSPMPTWATVRTGRRSPPSTSTATWPATRVSSTPTTSGPAGTCACPAKANAARRRCPPDDWTRAARPVARASARVGGARPGLAHLRRTGPPLPAPAPPGAFRGRPRPAPVALGESDRHGGTARPLPRRAGTRRLREGELPPRGRGARARGCAPARRAGHLRGALGGHLLVGAARTRRPGRLRPRRRRRRLAGGALPAGARRRLLPLRPRRAAGG